MSKRKTVYDSSDEATVAKAMKDQEDVEKDFEWILSNSRGRRWLYELIFVKCHIDEISHVPRDTHSTAFNEGARAIGELLKQDASQNHKSLFIKMLDENS